MVLELKRTNPMKHILSKHAVGLSIMMTTSPKSRAPVRSAAQRRAVQRGRRLRNVQRRSLQQGRESRIPTKTNTQTTTNTQATASAHALPFRKARPAHLQIVRCVRYQPEPVLPVL